MERVFIWQEFSMSHFQLIVLLGATSSGKSDLAVDLAIKLGNTVVVGCDSRQVYQGSYLGTGKVSGEWQKVKKRALFAPQFDKIFWYRGIPHFLIDYISPKEPYNVVRFQQDFSTLVHQLQSLTTPPTTIILTGGTGYYAEAVLKGLIFPQVSTPSQLLPWQLRSLYIQKALKTGRVLNNSDFLNPRKLQKFTGERLHFNGLLPELQLSGVFALTLSKVELQQRIYKRILLRLESGMELEFNEFWHKYQGSATNGIEYEAMTYEKLGMLKEGEIIPLIYQQTIQYAKRQITWIKRMDYHPVQNLEQIVTLLNLPKKD